jgi:hypothetical protein
MRPLFHVLLIVLIHCVMIIDKHVYGTEQSSLQNNQKIIVGTNTLVLSLL